MSNIEPQTKFCFVYTSILFVLAMILISRIGDRVNTINQANLKYKVEFLGAVRILDNNVRVLKKRIENLEQKNGK